MKIIKKILWELWAFFTPYVHPFEWKINRFCRWVTSYRSKYDVEKKLMSLMQENLIIVAIWLEKKYKNYRYLNKKTRRKLYKNASLIKEDFNSFCQMQSNNDGNHQEKNHMILDERTVYIEKIMKYFSPGRGKYEYKEGVSFGKLLTNPKTEKYIGDCNQIVTLYTAFYAEKYPINELQIKLIPGHVCLHLRDDDIEATNGTIKHYESFDYIAPITELIATNLLDINEESEKTGSIDPEIFVKGAQLAALLSQKREIVEKNMRVAYHNLCVRALNQHDLTKALFYAKKLENNELLKACYTQEYNALATRVSTIKTVQEAKLKKDVYRRMLELARIMGNLENAVTIEKILDQMNRS